MPFTDKNFKYELIDFFDDKTENAIIHTFKKKLVVGETFKKDDVVYEIEDADWWHDRRKGKAIIRMVRYRIPNTATQFVHKCPAKKKAMEKLDKDDILQIEKKYGKKGAEKRIKQWKAGRTKMNSHNKVEIKCPLCKCVFWKEKNEVPEAVTIDGVMNKKVLKSKGKKK